MKKSGGDPDDEKNKKGTTAVKQKVKSSASTQSCSASSARWLALAGGVAGVVDETTHSRLVLSTASLSAPRSLSRSPCH